MVLAVNWPPQEPADGQATHSSSCRSSSLTSPTACLPTASNTSTTVTSRPWKRPGRIEPPYMNTDGTLSRTIAIIMPGQRLVAAGEADQRVVAMAAHRQLDGVGDDLAADQRGLHARMAHRDAVGDGDGGELARRAAAPPRRPSSPPAPGATSAMLQGAASFQVVATPTKRLVDLLLGQAHRIEEGAVRRALRADRDVPARQARLVDRGAADVVRHLGVSRRRR